MTLPKYLTTITTFSKLLALFLFLFFPIVGFYVGMQYKNLHMMSNNLKVLGATGVCTSIDTLVILGTYLLQIFVIATMVILAIIYFIKQRKGSVSRRFIKKCIVILAIEIMIWISLLALHDYDVKHGIACGYNNSDVLPPITLDNSSWKTYTTKQFTFRYPPEYQVDKTNYDSYFISSPSNPSILPIKINIMQQYIGDTFDQIVERAKGSFLPGSNIAMTNTDYGIMISGQEPGYVKSIPMTFAFIRYKNAAIDFEQDVTESQTTMLKAIISTIKFIDGESSSPTKATNTAESCVRAGCSGQLCLSASKAKDTVTTCEYKDEYACYQQAICERQANGQCGWTETLKLKNCLTQYRAN